MCTVVKSLCGERVHVVEIVIARSGAESGGLATLDTSFFVRNPSVRLHLSLSAFARPNKTGISGGGGHVYTGETWQGYTVAEGTPDVRCNAVFVDTTGAAAPLALPSMYEGTTGAKTLSFDVHCVAQGAGQHDDYVIQAIWEPEAGGERMTDVEWDQLRNQCLLKGPNEIKLLG